MIIVCPDCSARFVVKAEAIGEAGRKVKCAKCKHTWFQKPDVEALEAVKIANPIEEPKETAPIPEGSNVPVLKKDAAGISLKIAASVAFVLFVLTLSIAFANKILPSMSGYYSLFGLYDTKDISLYDVSVEKVDSGKYQDLVVSGKIGNDSDTEKRIPALRLVILGEGGEKLKVVTLDSEGEKVGPGEKVDFQNKVTKLPQKATKVVMDLGNSLDLSSR